MDHTKKVSTWQVALKWVLIVGIFVGVSSLVFVLRSVAPSGPSMGGDESLSDNPLMHAIVFIFLGVVTLGFGVVAYVIFIFTDCFTFNFNKPVWHTMKLKNYILNVFIVVPLSLGPGLILAALLAPVLVEFRAGAGAGGSPARAG